MKKLLVIMLSLSLSLFACNKKKDDAKADPKKPGADMTADGPKEPVKPAAPAFVDAKVVNADDEKISCYSDSCTVQVVTRKVKEEIEKKENYKTFRVFLRSGSSVEYARTIANLPWVRKLSIQSSSVDNLEMLAGLVELEELDASYLKIGDGKDEKKVLSLAPLKNMKNLKELKLTQTRVEGFDVLADKTALVKLEVNETKVADLKFLEKLVNLEELGINGSTATDLAPLANLTKLKKLSLSSVAFKDGAPLAKLTALEYIYMPYATMPDLKLFAGMKALRELNLSYAKGELKDLAPLNDLTALETLDLSGHKGFEDLNAYTACGNLKNLLLSSTAVKNLKALEKCVNLVSLVVVDGPLADISPLARLAKLERVDLTRTAVKDLKPLKALAEMKNLSIGGTPVADLSPIANLKKMIDIYASKTAIKDLRALKGLVELTRVSISETAVSDLGPLAKCEKLWSLSINGSKVKKIDPVLKLAKLSSIYVDKDFPEAEKDKLKKALPSASINVW